MQNLEDNMDARKIKLPLGDIQAVREVADKVNAAQGWLSQGLHEGVVCRYDVYGQFHCVLD